MKMYCKTLAFTAVIAALSLPVMAQDVSDAGSQSMLSSAYLAAEGEAAQTDANVATAGETAPADVAAATEAAQMVAAIAELPHTLDADKDHLNSTFEAQLNGKITLSNGTVLPSRTVLIGKVTRDDTQATGASEFAVRFDQARLKDGKTLPIKATIVAIRRPTSDSDYEGSNDWTSQTLTVEQLNAVSGADLHSQIAGNDSAVFVSTRKHDVKVPAGTQLNLAIAPAADAPASTN
jgi:hypothetical protein